MCGLVGLYRKLGPQRCVACSLRLICFFFFMFLVWLVWGLGVLGRACNDWDKAEEILSVMRSRGIKPNEVTYTALIGICRRSGDVHQALVSNIYLFVIKKKTPRCFFCTYYMKGSCSSRCSSRQTETGKLVCRRELFFGSRCDSTRGDFLFLL